MNGGSVDYKQHQKRAASNAGKTAERETQLQNQGQETRKYCQKCMKFHHTENKWHQHCLPSDSEGDSKEELEYPGRGATYKDWDVFHKQQIQFVQYQFDEKVKALQKLQDKYKMLEEKLKKANKDKTLVARNATRQALQLVQQPVPFDEREYTRVTHYARKDLFQTFKFFTTEEEVLDFSTKGSPGEMTMAYFNIVPEKQMKWWNQYWLVIEEGITYSRHATQTLIGNDLKSKCT